MTPEDVKEGKRQLSILCNAIGCSGLSTECPGNPKCGILRKIGRSRWAAQQIDSRLTPARADAEHGPDKNLEQEPT
jgi:hypothetical protein